MAKKRKRSNPPQPKKEQQRKIQRDPALNQCLRAINNLEISIKTIKDMLIIKGIATEKEIDDEWNKVWEEYNKPKR